MPELVFMFLIVRKRTSTLQLSYP